MKFISVLMDGEILNQVPLEDLTEDQVDPVLEVVSNLLGDVFGVEVCVTDNCEG